MPSSPRRHGHSDWWYTSQQKDKPIWTGILSLPPELIIHIFGLGFKVFEGSEEGTVLGADDPYGGDEEVLFKYRVRYLCSISAVCSLWRAIALSAPEFWTSIIVFPKTLKLTLKSTISLLNAFLDRSKNLGLSFILRTHPRDFTISFGFLARIESIISPHLHRCHRLSFIDESGNPSPKALNLFFPLSKYGSLARLEILHVIHYGLLNSSTKPIFGDPAVAPNLVHLTVQNIRLVERLPASITQLALQTTGLMRPGQFDWPYISSVLTPFAPTLEQLILRFPLSRLERPPTPILFPKLRSVDVHDIPIEQYFVTNENLEQITCWHFSGDLKSVCLMPFVRGLALYGPTEHAFEHWDLSPSTNWVEGIQTLKVVKYLWTDRLLNILLPLPEEEGEGREIVVQPTVAVQALRLPSLRTLRLERCFTADISPATTWRHVLRLLDSRPELCIECDWILFRYQEKHTSGVKNSEKNKDEEYSLLRNWLLGSDDRRKYESRLHIAMWWPEPGVLFKRVW